MVDRVEGVWGKQRWYQYSWVGFLHISWDERTVVYTGKSAAVWSRSREF